LFNLDNMESALEMIKDTLLGPLGIKTLDPADWAYRGNYDNSNDSNDATVAHGFNYHQGPEWLWLCCYFYRAFLTVSRLKRGPASCFEAVQQIQKWILFHKKYIQENQFAGLPELTNQNGAMCHGSCPTQAWSTAVMIEVIHDLKQLC
jgi:glycogen debranching enzyme